MSEPDYKDLYFEPDMSWEEFVKKTNYHTFQEISGKITKIVIKASSDLDITVENNKRLYVSDIWRTTLVGKLKSFNAIKEVIEAIMRGVK